ncbi:MAG: ComEC/Rec2 family competence protein [Victivallales bacterium]
MLKIKKLLEDQFRLNPSLAILAGLMAGILPFAMDPEIRDFYALILPLFAVAISWIFLNHGLCFKIGLFALIGFLLIMVARSPSGKHYDSMLPDRNCGAVVVAQVADTTCSSSDDSSWMSQPYLMKINVEKFKYSASDEWKRTEGSSAVILPRECPRLGYGDIIVMKGAFILPTHPLFKGDFDFKRYLLANGTRRIYKAESCVIESRPGKYYFYRNVLIFRDFLMNKSVDGMKDIENKKIGAAIIFGCRQGLNAEDRKNFLKSGTIHVFSISGLHVGIIAVMLFWAFRWVPFTARHLVVPAIIFLYVFTTGMPPPAVRAFLMISVWCVQRAFLYPSSSMNSVYFAASMILIYNPFAVLDVGFQFSFIVAGFLVLSWNNSEKWVASALELSRWLPSGGGLTFYLLKTRSIRTLLRSLITSLVAWLSGLGLCLVYQGIFVPSSIITNFAIIPFVSLFVAAVVAKIFVYPLAPLANIADAVSEWSLNVIRTASELGASFGNEYLLKPPFLILILFYIAVTVLVVTQRKKVFFISAASIVLMISLWYWKCSFSSGSVFVLCGGESQEPVIAVCPPGKRGAFVINASSKETSRPLLNIFAGRGIDYVDTLLVCESRKDFCAGSRYVLTGTRVSNLMIPEKYRQSWFSKNTVENASASGCEIKVISKDSMIVGSGNISYRSERRVGNGADYFIECVLPEYKIELKILNSGAGIRLLEISTAGSNNIKMEIINTSIPYMKEFKLEVL